jgi:hypothetical protein
MNLPGFGAETSLYRTTRSYQHVVTGSPGVAAIQPAQFLARAGGGLAATCGQCKCDPGQCCEADSKGCRCTNCGPTPIPFPIPPIIW